MEPKELREILEHKEQEDIKEYRENKEKDLRAILETLVLKGQQAHKVRLAHKDQLELKELLAHKEQQELKELQEEQQIHTSS